LGVVFLWPGDVAFIEDAADEVIDLTGPVAATMANVVGKFGAEYLKAYGKKMPWTHRNAIDAIGRCRTPRAGGEVVACSACGSQSYVFRSCRHRSCTKCNRHKGQEWYEARQSELLPTPYFHIVFTVPEELRRVIRTHQVKVYPELMRAAAETLKDIGANPAHLGGEIAVMAVLHTWTRTLEYHPHVHCLVPSGFLDADGRWHEVKRPWFAPGETLAEVFRAKLCAGMRKVVDGLQLPGSIHHKPWVVHVDRPVDGRDRVLQYLSRYVHRGPMSDSRILRVDDEHVTFKYQDKDRRKKPKTMQLKGREFLRRFLQHVTPKGFHRVRYYGLWGKANRRRLQALRAELLAAKELDAGATTSSSAIPEHQPTACKEKKCPMCDSGGLYRLGIFFRRGEVPPALRLAAGNGRRIRVPFPEVAAYIAAWRRAHPRPATTAPS
jgi:hypothetical protein